MFLSKSLDEVMTLDHPLIIDVRDDEEFNHGHIKGSLHIPLHRFERSLKSLNKDKTYYVLCHSGTRSYYACTLAANQGFKVVNINGGISMYKGAMSYEV